MQRSGREPRAIGYLAVCEDDQQRFFGGLLLIDRIGRPLEFHCTAPIVPSRAHSILYGPTLADHVCGELIAPALLRHAKLTPQVVLTDRREVLPCRGELGCPLLLVVDLDEGEAKLQAHSEHPSDLELLNRLWPSFAAHVDLTEPLTRIREALEEARKAA